MAAALVIGSAFSAPTSPFCSLSSGRDSGVRMACGCAFTTVMAARERRGRLRSWARARDCAGRQSDNRRAPEDEELLLLAYYCLLLFIHPKMKSSSSLFITVYLPEDEELLLLAVVARDEAEGPRLLLNGAQSSAARPRHRCHALLRHVHHRDVAHVPRAVDAHLADQSQTLNRNIPRRRTSHSPSIGIYPDAGPVAAPQ
eukprot:1194455-Prorocentrum_minimum.AAC.2